VAVEFGSIATRMQQQTQAAGAAAGTTTGRSEASAVVEGRWGPALPRSLRNYLAPSCYKLTQLAHYRSPPLTKTASVSDGGHFDLLARGTPMLTAFSAMMHQLLGS
jgi:hypothetical protein